LLGASYKEASYYSGISEKTLKNYIKKDPELLPQIELWRSEPTLKAKQTIKENLHQPKVAMWYLERKAQDFKPKQDISSEDKPIPILSFVNSVPRPQAEQPPGQ
jgi:hypothetical protein